MGERHPEVLEFMRTRRSVPARMMGQPGPGEAEVAELVAIAARVPDHGKIAPWRFVRYSPRRCEELGQIVLRRALQREGALSQDMQ